MQNKVEHVTEWETIQPTRTYTNNASDTVMATTGAVMS